jgi:uncharacterized protein YciI
MQDMNDDERKTMMAHAAYWQGLLEKGKAVVFGPVLDPKGGWGLGVLEAADQAELRGLLEEDPVSRSGLPFKFETLPMPRAIYKK